MIEAVIWDFGGVLTSSPFEAFARYERERGLPENFIRGINATNPDTNAWALFERSEVTLEQFDDLFAQEAIAKGHEVRGRAVVELLSGDIRPAVVNGLKACKTRVKVGCITNNVPAGKGAGMARSAEKAAQVAEVMALFDHVIESSKLGIRKPDPRIYELACETLEVSPANCVYLDDLGINLKPAKMLGMTTIKVVEPDQAMAELETAVGFPVG
ncbi:MAG: HAD-IA family hydrolase [Parvibaculum sp.]